MTINQGDDPATAQDEAQEASPADPRENDNPSNDTPNDDPGDASEIAKVRREAATYRTRLRDTEAERDRLAGALQTYHREAVERAIGDRLAQPSDIWLETPDPDEYLSEEGLVDHEKVDASVAEILAKHPSWAPHPPAPLPRRKPTENLKGGINPDQRPTSSWADVMRPAQ